MIEKIIDVFQPEVNFTLEEAKGEVDGKYVLGKVKGQFFVPDGISRNRRYYSRSLWERAISKVKDKLKNRTMFGTIGHEQEINDTALLEGKISHVVTNLYIDEQGRGIGEALILNTPAGRVLNTLLRAGSKLYTSSRAEGKYNGTVHGVPKVDEDAYDLKGFDFVVDPGFLEAQPELVESIQKDLDYCFSSTKDKDNGGGDMGTNELLEAKVKENLKLREDLDKALTEVDELRRKLSESEVRFKDLQAKLEERQKELNGLKKKEDLLSRYERLGSPEEIEEALDKAKEVLLKYKVLGSPEEIEEALDKAEEILTKYKELGSPEEIEEAFGKVEKVLLKYKELGSPEEIEEVFDKTEALLKETVKEAKERKAEALAKELGVNVDLVKKVYGKMTEEEVREFFRSFKESAKVMEKYSFKESYDKDNDNDDEGKNLIFESRGERLLSYFCK